MTMMIHQLYDSATQAQRVVEALTDAGVPPENLRLLMSDGATNGQNQPVGSFVTGDGHDHGSDPMGSFATSDTSGSTDPHPGSFADTDSSHAHDERVGSFASVDRDTITTFVRGKPQTTTHTHASIVRLLIGAGMDQATAEQQIVALHEGKALVLADVADNDSERLQQILASA
jgi:hypothetical protein